MKTLSSLYKNKWFKPVILTVFCFIFYGNTIPNYYAYDDGMVVIENQFTKSGFAGIPSFFKHDLFYGCFGTDATNLASGGRYRPLPLATFAIEYQFFGKNPYISHFNNILLLVLASLILFILLSKIFSTHLNKNNFFDLPFVTALLFIAHPVHTEVVANIKSRDEIMAMIGSLTTVLFILKYLDTDRYKHLVMSFISFFLALLSKENAITFLAIVPLSIYFYKKENWVKYLISLIPVCLATIFFLIIRMLAVGKFSPPPDDLLNNPYIYATISEKFATIFYVLGIYVKLLFWPHPLTYDYYPYHIKFVNWNNIFTLLSLLVYMSLISYALLKITKKTVISFGILFYIITISVVSNLFIVSAGSFMGERFLFIPSIGFLLIITWFLTVKIPELVQSYNFKMPLLIAILMLCFFKTYSRNKVWRDNFTLFTTDVKTSSNSIQGNMIVARLYLDMANETVDDLLKKQYLEIALKYSKKTFSICPNHIDAVAILADAYTANNMFDSAIFCFQKAIYSMPGNSEFISMKVEEIMDKISDADFKIKSYLGFVKLSPDNFSFNYQLACLFAEYKHDFKKSGFYLQKSVEIMPGNYLANMALGINYRLLGDYYKSSVYLEKALKINPKYLPIYENLLITYKFLGNMEKEKVVLKKIEELKNENKN